MDGEIAYTGIVAKIFSLTKGHRDMGDIESKLDLSVELVDFLFKFPEWVASNEGKVRQIAKRLLQVELSSEILLVNSLEYALPSLPHSVSQLEGYFSSCSSSLQYHFLQNITAVALDSIVNIETTRRADKKRLILYQKRLENLHQAASVGLSFGHYDNLKWKSSIHDTHRAITELEKEGLFADPNVQDPKFIVLISGNRRENSLLQANFYLSAFNDTQNNYFIVDCRELERIFRSLDTYRARYMAELIKISTEKNIMDYNPSKIVFVGFKNQLPKSEIIKLELYKPNTDEISYVKNLKIANIKIKYNH